MPFLVVETRSAPRCSPAIGVEKVGQAWIWVMERQREREMELQAI